LQSQGLAGIHDRKLIHRDFHCRNILSNDSTATFITDLGLCSKPANEKSEKSEKRIYGVLPYVAPEVLRGKEYTQLSKQVIFMVLELLRMKCVQDILLIMI
jgi:serine/threonine protein kinase